MFGCGCCIHHFRVIYMNITSFICTIEIKKTIIFLHFSPFTFVPVLLCENEKTENSFFFNSTHLFVNEKHKKTSFDKCVCIIIKKWISIWIKNENYRRNVGLLFTDELFWTESFWNVMGFAIESRERETEKGFYYYLQNTHILIRKYWLKKNAHSKQAHSARRTIHRTFFFPSCCSEWSS